MADRFGFGGFVASSVGRSLAPLAALVGLACSSIVTSGYLWPDSTPQKGRLGFFFRFCAIFRTFRVHGIALLHFKRSVSVFGLGVFKILELQLRAVRTKGLGSWASGIGEKLHQNHYFYLAFRNVPYGSPGCSPIAVLCRGPGTVVYYS